MWFTFYARFIAGRFFTLWTTKEALMDNILL